MALDRWAKLREAERYQLNIAEKYYREQQWKVAADEYEKFLKLYDKGAGRFRMRIEVVALPGQSAPAQHRHHGWLSIGDRLFPRLSGGRHRRPVHRPD